MKKSRFLKILCSAMLCLAVGFMFMGCDVEEVKQATTAGIEATTNIIPVEYSKDVATSTFISAMNNSLSKGSYYAKFSGEGFNTGVVVEKHSAELYFVSDVNMCFYAYSVDGGDAHIYSKVGNEYYDFNMVSKTYTQNKDYASYALVPIKSVLTNIICGKYYNGQDHVYSCLESAGNITYVDYVIENGLIVEIKQSIYLNSEFIYSKANLKFEYSDNINNNLPTIPTSLDGFENA